MNEFVTDLEKPYKPAGGWMSASSCPLETSMLQAMTSKSPPMKRSRDFSSVFVKQDGNETSAANAVMHNHHYPSVLVGIGAGALLGYFVACRLSGKSC